MRSGSVRGLLALLAASAWAPGAAAQDARPQVPAQELDATRHHQPSQAEVDQREQALHGNDAAAAREAARQQAAVDRLYRELTGKTPKPPLSGSSVPPSK